jgi:hypothetical protein
MQAYFACCLRIMCTISIPLRITRAKAADLRRSRSKFQYLNPNCLVLAYGVIAAYITQDHIDDMIFALFEIPRLFQISLKQHR